MNIFITVIGILIVIFFGHEVYKDLNKPVYFNGQVSTTDVQNMPEVSENGTHRIVVIGGDTNREDPLRQTLDAITNEKGGVDARKLAEYLISDKN